MTETAAEGLRRAAALHGRGDMTGAVKTANAVVARHPDDAAALHFLGVLCCQSGRTQEGAAYLERACRKEPKNEDIRLNLAQALLELGRVEEAETLCLAPEAKSERFQRLRADISKARGRGEEAAAHYEQLARANPSDPAVWNNLGNLYADLGDLDRACTALQRARSLDPRNAVIPANLGRILHALRKPGESRQMFEEALRLAPNEPGRLVEIGNLLLQVEQPQLALMAYSAAARLNPRDPNMFVLIGQSFAALSDRKQAEQAYRMALHVDRRWAPAYLNLAIILEQENRTGDLQQLAEEARANGVGGGEMNYISALLCRREKDFAEALRLAQDAVAESLDPTVRAHFIGQVADRLGDTYTAFAAFEEMNRLTATSAAGEVFTGDEHRQEVEQANAATSAEWYASWTAASPRCEPASPVFLMGFLRSGTTLLDTILMGHPDTYVVEEEPMLARVERSGASLDQLASLGEQELTRLRTQYFEELHASGHQPGEKLVIDKNPLAALRAPLIHRIFPDARFIFAVRHPCDVVLSCYMQNFRASQSMASFFDLRKAASFYDSVMAYWSKCRVLMPLEVHSIRYEDLVEDVESEIRPLLDFLGLDWDPAVLDHQKTAAERGYIRTPSYAQVTEQIYRRSTGRWTRYREYMEDVLPILRPWAEEFGYEID